MAWLAILGLMVQLSAAAACTMGAEASGPLADLAAFPICHGHGVDEASAPSRTPGRDGHHAPGHQAPCPFCALHCHAALASPPTIETRLAVAIVAIDPPPARLPVHTTVRVCAAASPRGPPRA